ncbi:MAG TPA: hypothetical protein VHT51_16500 [Micropepsaceae bacterium]|jgi:hypothetical protein|nr:hypothetical protein [Micropepsaceae bacterium]
MIDPNQLLGVARLLAMPPRRGAPQQAKLRRSISSAYYALFHHLLESATIELIGANRRQPSYGIVYRSFEHADLRKSCAQVQLPILAKEVQKAVGFASFGPDIRECATFFVELQQARHEADYNPVARISLSDARGAIAKAEGAIAALDRAPAQQRKLFLTLLHFKVRS